MEFPRTSLFFFLFIANFSFWGGRSTLYTVVSSLFTSQPTSIPFFLLPLLGNFFSVTYYIQKPTREIKTMVDWWTLVDSVKALPWPPEDWVPRIFWTRKRGLGILYEPHIWKWPHKNYLLTVSSILGEGGVEAAQNWREANGPTEGEVECSSQPRPSYAMITSDPKFQWLTTIMIHFWCYMSIKMAVLLLVQSLLQDLALWSSLYFIFYLLDFVVIFNMIYGMFKKKYMKSMQLFDKQL